MVSETLGTNTCAGGFNPDAQLDYLTDIRVQGEVSYWHRGDTPIASGTYSADGHFHFISQVDIQAYGVDAGAGGPPGCTLREVETIDGTLMLGTRDAGMRDAQGSADASTSADASSLDVGAIDGGPDAGVHSTGFTGTDTIQLTVAPGSDCTRVFAVNGGPFSMLPCTATYAMTGTAN